MVEEQGAKRTDGTGNGGPVRVEGDALIDHLNLCWQEETKNADELAFRENLILSAIAVLMGVGLFQIEWYREDKGAVVGEGVHWWLRGLLLTAMALFLLAFLRVFGKGLSGYADYWNKQARRWLLALSQWYWTQWTTLLHEGERNAWEQQVAAPALLARAARRAIESHAAWEKARSMKRGGNRPRRSSYLLALPEGVFAPGLNPALAREAIVDALKAAYVDVRERNGERAKRLNMAQQLFLLGLLVNAAAIVVYILQLPWVQSR